MAEYVFSVPPEWDNAKAGHMGPALQGTMIYECCGMALHFFRTRSCMNAITTSSTAR